MGAVKTEDKFGLDFMLFMLNHAKSHPMGSFDLHSCTDQNMSRQENKCYTSFLFCFWFFWGGGGDDK